jgi:integrase
MKIYRRREGGSFWIDFYDATGKRVRKSLKVTNKRAAERLADRIRARVESERLGLPVSVVRKSISFEAFAKEYLEHHASKKTDGGKVDECRIRLHLLPYFKGMNLASITQADLVEYQTKRLGEDNKERRSGKYTPSSVNRDLQLLKSVLSRAVEWGYLDRSPGQGFKLQREDNSRMRVLTPKEEARILKVSGTPLKEFVVIGLNTALRKGEMLGLEWPHIDLQHKQLYVHKSKGGEPRRVPLNKKAVAALKRLKPRESGKLFPIANNVNRTFNHACKKAKVKGVTIHTLRHTAISRLIARVADIASVKEIAGHADIKTTYRYVHSTSARSAIELLED